MNWDFDLTQGLINLAVMFPPFILAVVFHEYAHGFIAYKWGDQTAKGAGRLTLNPFPHMDPIGTFLFPTFMMVTGLNILFGWAKPVPIDPSQFKKFRPGLFWVAFAGPLMNVVLAFGSCIVLCILGQYVSSDFYFYEPFFAMCIASILLNFALCFFNLIPLPPLDGSKMVQSFLSLKAAHRYEQISRYSFLILLVLLWSGKLKYIFIPIVFAANAVLQVAGVLTGSTEFVERFLTQPEGAIFNVG